MGVTVMLIGIGLQIASSIINQKLNQKNSVSIRDMQQNFKREMQKRSLERDYEKFRRSCELQLAMEEDSHKERLKIIKDELTNWFTIEIHKKSVENSPLRICPYIIEKSVISFGGGIHSQLCEKVFVILTSSNDSVFNGNIKPILDNMLCDTMSKYWNQKSAHTCCYYPNLWDDKIGWDKIDDLKNLVCTPTLSITPYFEEVGNGYKLTIKMKIWWGTIAEEGQDAVFETGLNYEKIPQSYEPENDIDKMVPKLFQTIIYAIATAVDAYYWARYYQPPLFPSMIASRQIGMDNSTLSMCRDFYKCLYETTALGKSTKYNDVVKVNFNRVKELAELNQCNFPERSMRFLRSLTNIVDKTESDGLIRESVKSIYTARTDRKADTLSAIDVSILGTNDIEVISDMIPIAKSVGNLQLADELTDIIRRKIRKWN